jgi:hypothetical protein
MAELKSIEMPLGTEEDLQIWKLLRGNAPIPPGACRDCGGHRLVPSMEATSEARECGIGLWRSCPTCRGTGQGGSA